jgi:hypothetical protein
MHVKFGIYAPCQGALVGRSVHGGDVAMYNWELVSRSLKYGLEDGAGSFLYIT